jgi:hypothetical protein
VFRGLNLAAWKTTRPLRAALMRARRRRRPHHHRGLPYGGVMQPFCYHTSLICFLVKSMTKTFLIAIETVSQQDTVEKSAATGGSKKCAFHCLSEQNVSGCG